MPSHRRSAATPAAEATAEGSLRILKKYPNRRLYDTQTSSYITLADVKQMVLKGEHFEVRDAKTADDLTRSILLQIILEEETGGLGVAHLKVLALQHHLLDVGQRDVAAGLGVVEAAVDRKSVV